MKRIALLPLCVAFCCLLTATAQATDVGDSVLAHWAPGNAYFIGTAVERTPTGYMIVFEDGDTANVPASKIRPLDLKVGSTVHARWSDGSYYQGKIAKAVGKAFYIQFDDGDKAWVPWSSIALK